MLIEVLFARKNGLPVLRPANFCGGMEAIGRQVRSEQFYSDECLRWCESLTEFNFCGFVNVVEKYSIRQFTIRLKINLPAIERHTMFVPYT